MRLLLLACGLCVATASLATPAHAQNYPWCANYSGDFGDTRNCGFVTFDQCMNTVRGMGGFCVVNNTYHPLPGAHRPLGLRPHPSR